MPPKQKSQKKTGIHGFASLGESNNSGIHGFGHLRESKNTGRVTKPKYKVKKTGGRTLGGTTTAADKCMAKAAGEAMAAKDVKTKDTSDALDKKVKTTTTKDQAETEHENHGTGELEGEAEQDIAKDDSMQDAAGEEANNE
ncbi:Hypothetical protein D9617_8g051680 [Elsinoe fawcettii]|nr:Hypothetical protein D9617_8g051680 [Elsinoe fawcettii]